PCVSEDSDWDDRKNCKIEGLNVSYDYMMGMYYLKKYKVDVAFDSILNYYRHYPNVASFEEFEDLGSGFYKIICYNGYETLFQFRRDNFIKKYSEKKSQKTNDVLEMYSEVFKSNLNDGIVLFFSSTQSIKEVNLTSEEDIFAICSYNSHDSLPSENVITSSFTINKKMVIKQVFEEYKNNNSFKNRIQNNKKTNNKKTESNTIKNVSKTFDLNNYSPSKSNFVAFFPVDYEVNVSKMLAEIESVESNIKDQGYVFSNENYLYDQTANDDDFANMPYSQLTELCSEAGFLYVGTHGDTNTLLIARGMDPNLLGYWCNYDEDVHIVPVAVQDYPPEWEIDNPLFNAIVNSDWINKYWKNDLENNNTITILSACKAIVGIGDACAGGICFGYDDDTYYSSCIKNNKNLLKRMNGEKKGAQYRNAIEAYNNMPLLNGFNYAANSNITLCPATKSFYPKNNSIVSSDVNAGEFVIDTWCDASVLAHQALSLEITNGDLTHSPIDDIYWDNPIGGKSNKIIYRWTGTHGTVRVKVNTNKIRAYGGGGQKLDFDRKTPNGETNAYYVFYVGNANQNPNVVDFVASQYEALAYTPIHFTNQSSVYNSNGYFWDFGDGTTSTQENPTHTYTDQGVYDVTLKVSTNIDDFYETKNGLITILSECSGTLYSYFDVINDKKVNFQVSYTGAYEPLVYEYRFTIYFGDGTHQSKQGIFNIENFEKEYSNFGDYYPIILVETLNQFGESICLKEYEMGLVQLNNPFPCSDFNVDFNISPDVAYLNSSLPNPIVTVNFNNTTSGGNNYTWIWQFDADLENGYEPQGGVAVSQYIQSFGDSGNTSKNYTKTGIYPVTLTVFDENGCYGTKTKNVFIADKLRCINNLRIQSYSAVSDIATNRIIVPWQHNNQECLISLKSEYEFCRQCPSCKDCGESWQVYKWYVNNDLIKEEIV
ncbi:MAG: PKD domain-containing protein, partial [Bacteroidales bacterium]